MSWEAQEAAKKIAEGWYAELEATRKRNAVLRRENAKLRELATYALRYIVEVCCKGEGRDLCRGKPCEDCVDAGSSDCPKCMPRVFDVSGIEVEE